MIGEVCVPETSRAAAISASASLRVFNGLAAGPAERVGETALFPISARQRREGMVRVADRCQTRGTARALDIRRGRGRSEVARGRNPGAGVSEPADHLGRPVRHPDGLPRHAVGHRPGARGRHVERREEVGLRRRVQTQSRHPRESGGPGATAHQLPWIPAFAGMTIQFEPIALYSAAIMRSSSAADRIGAPSIDWEGFPSTPTSFCPTSVMR